MIKPLNEYSPEERKFVEYVEQIRRQAPRPRVPCKDCKEQADAQGPGPINWAEMDAILSELSAEERDFPWR